MKELLLMLKEVILKSVKSGYFYLLLIIPSMWIIADAYFSKISFQLFLSFSTLGFVAYLFYLRSMSNQFISQNSLKITVDLFITTFKILGLMLIFSMASVLFTDPIDNFSAHSTLMMIFSCFVLFLMNFAISRTLINRATSGSFRGAFKLIKTRFSIYNGLFTTSLLILILFEIFISDLFSGSILTKIISSISLLLILTLIPMFQLSLAAIMKKKELTIH